MDLEAEVYEAKQRLTWFINGIGIHGISSQLFKNISTERIVELYNVEITFFRKNKL